MTSAYCVDGSVIFPGVRPPDISLSHTANGCNQHHTANRWRLFFGDVSGCRSRLGSPIRSHSVVNWRFVIAPTLELFTIYLRVLNCPYYMSNLS